MINNYTLQELDDTLDIISRQSNKGRWTNTFEISEELEIPRSRVQKICKVLRNEWKIHSWSLMCEDRQGYFWKGYILSE